MDPITIGLLSSLKRELSYVLSDSVARQFFFGGEVKSSHKTKFAVEKIVDRYNSSIESLNKSIVISVSFVPIAILLSGSDIKVPMLDITVSYVNWLRLCPAISFGIQFFTLIALSWFLILRGGLAILGKELGEVEYFGDVANTMLTGVVGSLWIFVAIPKLFPSRIHLVWLIPLITLFMILFLSPSILCGYFIFRLFLIGDFLAAVVYFLLLIPGFLLGLVLMGVSVLAGIREASGG
jgi:hypothetical protein